MATETVTVRLEAEGESDEIEIPVALLDRLSADDEETAPAVVGDLALLAFAQQAHGLVHHGHGQVSEELREAESQTLALFEERFGKSFAEVTGHSH